MDNETLEKYRKAGRIARAAKEYGCSLIKENASILQVVEQIEEFIIKNGGRPAFPVNIAINDVAAHYTPVYNETLSFKRKDVVKLDVGVHVDGFIGDTACTVEVNTNNWSHLIRASREALKLALEILKPNLDLCLVGAVIERTINSFGFKPISNLTGHSVSQYAIHTEPSVPNVMNGIKRMTKVGDVLAIEPFATNGAGRVEGSKISNIYRIIKEREFLKKKLESSFSTRLFHTRKEIENLQEFFAKIKEEYRTLPFSERWLYKIDKNASSYLRSLFRYGTIMSYPILKDIDGGIVTQAEHTAIITDSGAEIIT